MIVIKRVFSTTAFKAVPINRLSFQLQKNKSKKFYKIQKDWKNSKMSRKNSSFKEMATLVTAANAFGKAQYSAAYVRVNMFSSTECFSFWGFLQGDSSLTNQSATWLVYLRRVSISPGKTPKAKTHSVYQILHVLMS